MAQPEASLPYNFTVQTAAAIGAPALLWGLSLTPAAAASTVILYDNASAGSGTILSQLAATANGATVQMTFNTPIMALKGITAVVTGTGAVATVFATRSF